jgi:DNA-binding response OmpR family regulator
MSPLRSRSDAPVIAVLPAGTEVGDALDMLDAGADNYVVRPFSPRELVSRVNALWRRLPEDTRDPSRHFAFDGLTIDVANREVTVDDKPVNLAAKEFDLLVFLAASPRQVFSRDQLMRQVWGVEVALATATITEHVRRLRNRIERDPRKPRWIETVWSVGYRFNPGERRAAT